MTETKTEGMGAAQSAPWSLVGFAGEILTFGVWECSPCRTRFALTELGPLVAIPASFSRLALSAAVDLVWCQWARASSAMTATLFGGMAATRIATWSVGSTW